MGWKKITLIAVAIVAIGVFIIAVTSGYFRNQQSPLKSCDPASPVQFSASPLVLENLEMIGPMGIMVGAHVVPSDHLGFAPRRGATPQHTVVAPADGTIQSIQARTKSIETGEATKTEYHIVIQHACKFSTRYDLVNHLADGIKANVKIKAGEPLGTLDDDGHGLDFWTVDEKVTHDGTVNKDRIVREAWRLHVIDPFPYFTEPLQTQLRAKAMRKADPQGGKIDYDIDGRLVGDWYRPGTNDNSPNFWTNQFSFAYHWFDAKTPIISIGDWQGQPKQFTIKDGTLPKDVSVDTGLVKYELYVYEQVHADGSKWDFTKFANDIIARPAGSMVGTLLVQMTADRTIKVEEFPGKTAAEVTGFSDKAVIYER